MLIGMPRAARARFKFNGPGPARPGPARFKFDRPSPAWPDSHSMGPPGPARFIFDRPVPGPARPRFWIARVRPEREPGTISILSPDSQQKCFLFRAGFEICPYNQHFLEKYINCLYL